MTSAPISAARSTACGIGRSKGITRATPEDDHAALFQMARCTLPDVRLGNTVHLDCSLHAHRSRRAAPAQSSQRQRIDSASASMPIWSARVRSILPPPSLTPRQKLPPPTTMPISQPCSLHFLYRHRIPGRSRQNSGRNVLSPASASPLIFMRTRLYLCVSMLHILASFSRFYFTL